MESAVGYVREGKISPQYSMPCFQKTINPIANLVYQTVMPFTPPNPSEHTVTGTIGSDHYFSPIIVADIELENVLFDHIAEVRIEGLNHASAF